MFIENLGHSEQMAEQYGRAHAVNNNNFHFQTNNTKRPCGKKQHTSSKDPFTLCDLPLWFVFASNEL